MQEKDPDAKCGQESLDQAVHLNSLIRVLIALLWNLESVKLSPNREDPNQIGYIDRLIWALAVCKWHKGSFLMLCNIHKKFTVHGLCMKILTPIIWASTWQNLQNGICSQQRLRSAWASAVWSVIAVCSVGS